MALLNCILNQFEIQYLLEHDKDKAFAKLLEESLNCFLKAESAEQLKAEPYERTDERLGSRNGTRERPLTTRIGTLNLKVPKHRDGVPFKTLVFNNYARNESALILTMAEMVVKGVSTRKVSDVMEQLCGKSFSKSTVSEACKELDAKVKEFRDRPLENEYPFLILDATYFKVRENGRVVSKALMVAFAVNTEGEREIIGFNIYDKETNDTWNDFVRKLKKRGLKGVKMITSDSHNGIINAISGELPGVPWQRCQFHFQKNILSKMPLKYQKGLSVELNEMFNSNSIEEARKRRDEIISDYKDIAEEAMRCLDEGFEDAMTVMNLPKHLRKFFRTSNYIERLNRELKRRSDVIGVFPNENSLMRLMGAVLMDRNNDFASYKRIYTTESYPQYMKPSVQEKLKQIAEEQRLQLVA